MKRIKFMTIKYENPEFYIGKTKACYLGYATDPAIREGAASGGFISSFLVYLFEKKIVNRALVSKSCVENAQLKAFSFIARTRQDILDARTSIYMHFPYLRALRDIKAEPGRFAVVGLPCHLSAITRLETKFPWLKEKIAMKIGLFCSHASSPELILRVFKRNGIDLTKVVRFYFRTGHWRGFLTFLMKDGRIIKLPYLKFGLFMNLYFYERQVCLSCIDHTANYSDISCGDAWLKNLKKHPIKHSTLLIRNNESHDIFKKFCKNRSFEAKSISEKLVIKSQKRGLIRKKHYIHAFKEFAPLFGYKVSYAGPNYANWNHMIGAFFLMLNIKASKNRMLMDLVFKMPKPLLYGYVAFLKSFMSF